MKGNTEKDWE